MIASDQPVSFPKSVRIVVSSNDDGTTKFGVDQPDEVVSKNLEALSGALGLTKEQVAGISINYGTDQSYDVIKTVSRTDALDVTDRSTWIHCDALVTTESNLGMLIPIADCNGVVVYDPMHNVLALAHIGWHAATANLPSKLVAYLQKRYDSQPGELQLYISPSIRQASYHNADPVQLQLPAWKNYVDKQGDEYYIDVFGFVRDQFLQSGVAETNLEASPIDVATSKDYPSHFREKHQGREASRFAVLCTMV